MRPVDLLLVGGTVVVGNGSREVIHGGAVAVSGDRIVEVGPAATVAAGVSPRRTVDCNGMAVLPGLIDLHVHACQQLSRGLADDVSDLEWRARVGACESAMDENDVYASVRAACLEMIKGGTTGFVEFGANPFFVDAAAQAMADSGLRGVITRSTAEITDGQVPDRFVMDADSNLRATADMIRRWNGAADGRISARASWAGPGSVSDELLVRLVRLAREQSAGVATHAATRGYGEIEHLERLGVLGADLLLADVIRLTGRELDLIAEHDVKIAHDPGASMHRGLGAVRVGQHPEMLARGVCVGLGCGGAAQSNTLDMFHALRLAATVHNEARVDATLIPAVQALALATEHGARAAQWPSLGSLVPGMGADLIIVDLMQPHLVPVHDVIGNLVYCASGRDVVTTIVDGKILMEDREVRTIDEATALAEARSRAERLASAVNSGRMSRV
jgi:5-methylthioadenosine/S-adenosylhomocysteine deaminase